MKEQKLDVIGDVHGRKEVLVRLLERMGYRPVGGIWRHEERKALFIGDLVDRGPDTPGVLRLVKDMADAGSAEVLLGNHEYNLLCWYTPDGQGGFIRKRSGPAAQQAAATMAYLDAQPEAREEYLGWFQCLPIWQDHEAARFIHAYWGPKEIRFLGQRRNLRDCGWGDPHFRRSPEGQAIERLIKGPELRLQPEASFMDKHGVLRREARIKWWRNAHVQRLLDMLEPQHHDWGDRPFPLEGNRLFEALPGDAPPTVFGHYNLKTPPGLLAPNALSVDHQGPDGQQLCAYRWNGEPQHNAAHLITNQEDHP